MLKIYKVTQEETHHTFAYSAVVVFNNKTEVEEWQDKKNDSDDCKDHSEVILLGNLKKDSTVKHGEVCISVIK